MAHSDDDAFAGSLFSDFEAPDLYTIAGLTDALETYVEPPVLPPIPVWKRMPSEERAALNNARLDYVSGHIMVETDQILEVMAAVKKALLSNRARSSGRFGVLVDGESTFGKTTACLAVMKATYYVYSHQYPGFYDLPPERRPVPVVYFEIPAGSTGKAVMGQLLDCLGLPRHRSDSMSARLATVTNALRELKTVLVVVDEVHRLEDNSAGSTDSVNILKEMSNKVPATFLYSGKVSGSRLLVGSKGAQIAGRFSQVTMGTYGYRTDKEKQGWRDILDIVGDELCLFGVERGDLHALSDYLHLRSGGNIGTLVRLLSTAAQDLIIQNLDPTKERITKGLLNGIKLDILSEELEERRRRRHEVDNKSPARRPRAS